MFIINTQRQSGQIVKMVNVFGPREFKRRNSHLHTDVTKIHFNCITRGNIAFTPEQALTYSQG